MGASSQRKGAETSPWPRSRTHSATWLRGQHSRDGPEAGSGEHHFLGGRGQQEREVPYRRSQEGLPSPGVRVGHWARAGCSEKDLRQAQGLRAKADWAQGTEEGGTRKILWGSLARGGGLPDSVGLPGRGATGPSRTPLLSLERSWGTRSANLWTT